MPEVEKKPSTLTPPHPHATERHARGDDKHPSDDDKNNPARGLEEADKEAARSKQPDNVKPTGNVVWYATSKEGEEWFLWRQKDGKTERIDQSHTPNVIRERMVVEFVRRFDDVAAEAANRTSKPDYRAPVEPARHV